MALRLVFSSKLGPSPDHRLFTSGALTLCSPDTLFGDALPDDVPNLREAAGHLKPLPLTSQAVFYMGPKKFMLEDTAETPCLRVNRLQLREALTTGIEVQWGKEADKIVEDEDKVTVFFKDGTSATGDLLVGADGVHSSGRLWPSLGCLQNLY